jgi:hypothetical protein
MSEKLSKLLAEIQAASKAELRTLWQQSLPQSPPPDLPRNLMAAALAHREQELAFGSFSADLRARLQRLLHAIDTEPNGSVPPSASIKPGTRLVRQWKGHNHLVTVGASGFEYRGNRYENLSQIARLITATRWSGPLFFGLRTKPNHPRGQHE